jgi:uncharacterized protein YyaL (SSP411 family)
LGIDEEKLRQKVEQIRKKLARARAKRVQPGRDEKVITAWNGMMLKAFADGSRILGREDFRKTAVRNATFVLKHLKKGGRLLRSWKDGDARIGGYLEDYALYIDGLLALYRATLEARWLEEALRLAEKMVAEFADDEGAGFFDTTAAHGTPVARPRELHDGATPSGNAAAADVLLRIGVMTGNAEYSERAVAVLRALAKTMRQHPIAAGRYLSALDFYLGPTKEVALAGDRESSELQALLSAAFRRYEPNAVLGYVDDARAELTERLPFLQDRPARNGRATAYVCEHYACLPPVHDPADLLRQLEEGTGVSWRDF